MKNYILLLCAILFVVAVNAQFYVEGHVFDEETLENIENVNITVDGTSYGCASDSLGQFKLPVPHLPCDVTISHIFYKTENIRVKESSDLKKVRMAINYHLLPDVEIKAIVSLTDGYAMDIIDYSFMGDTIVLVGYDLKSDRENNPTFCCIKPNGDFLFKQVVGFEGHFYRDCLNTLHYVTDSMTYQLYNYKDSIKFLYPTPVDELNLIMNHCVCATQDHFIVEKFAFCEQQVTYYSVNKTDSTVKKIEKISDEQKLKMLSSEANYDLIEDRDLSIPYIQFLQNAFYDSIYCPVFIIRDSIFLFNFVANIVSVYNLDFRIQRDMDTRIMDDKHFKKPILHDSESDKVYTISGRFGYYELREVDLNTGKYGNSIKIPEYQWISKISVRNDKVYFLYREKFTGDLISLFRMNIGDGI